MPLAALFLLSDALAVPIPVGDSARLDVGGLVQVQAQAQPEAAPDGESLGFDLFVRRARLVVNGGLGDRWSFTFVTDSPNLGKNGDWTGRILVQDALISGKVGRGLQLDAGLILLPFGHHGLQSAGTLHTLDYHSSVMLYPTGSTQVWRDAGFQARGLLFSDRVHYRVGVFNGVEGVAGVDEAGLTVALANPADWPRFAGQVRVNLLGVEDRFYLGGAYFPEAPLFSVGASVVTQPGGVGTGEDATAWTGLAGDVFADVPVGEHQELLGQLTVVHYAAGPDAPTSGTGGFAELGWRFGRFEPVVSAEAFLSQAESSDSRALRLGLNVWVQRHTANVKGELALSQVGDAPDPTVTATIQTQLSF